MIYLPVLGAMLEAVGTIVEKMTLKIKGVNFKNYSVWSFYIKDHTEIKQ